MTDHNPPAHPDCPHCGKALTLEQLGYMAVGDGFRRIADVKLDDGTVLPLVFDGIGAIKFEDGDVELNKDIVPA